MCTSRSVRNTPAEVRSPNRIICKFELIIWIPDNTIPVQVIDSSCYLVCAVRLSAVLWVEVVEQ